VLFRSIENWSVTLDLAILFATVQRVLWRAVTVFRRRAAVVADDGERGRALVPLASAAIE
jgi:hypothetical protein